MKYTVTKNSFVLGKLRKMGTVIDIPDDDVKYFGDCIKKIAVEKPAKEKAVNK